MLSDIVLALGYLRQRLNLKQQPTFKDVMLCEAAADEIIKLRRQVAMLENELEHKPPVKDAK